MSAETPELRADLAIIADSEKQSEQKGGQR